MKQRLNFLEKGKTALKPLFALGSYLKNATIEESLRHLVFFRISQINGCAYCLDMHAKDARSQGETEQRLYGLSAWKEAPYYTRREKVAFLWAETVNNCHVTDETYDEARQEFSEEELLDLTMAVVAINSWNRLNIAFPHAIGTYRPGMFSTLHTSSADRG